MKNAFALVFLLFSLHTINVADGAGPAILGKMVRRENRVKNQYIVVMKENRTAPSTSMENFIGAMRKQGRDPGMLGRIGMMSVVTENENELSDMLADDAVAYIEEVIPMHGAGAPTQCERRAYSMDRDQWGLDRIDQENLPVDRVLRVDESNPSNEDVIIYVLDSGIYAEHPQFEGRASRGAKFVNWESELDDLNGHGTHCAGTAASAKYGVNKNAKIVAVKVLDRNSDGSTGTVGEGVAWVMQEHARRGGKGVAKSVISLSVGGRKAQALNDAIRRAYLEGIVVVAAAGNFEQNADEFSPSSAPEAIVVGASRFEDRRVRYSNFGPLVDIHAPGADIKSTWINEPSRRRRAAGSATSKASGRGARSTFESLSGSSSTCTCPNCDEKSARRRYLRRNPPTCNPEKTTKQATTTTTPATTTTTPTTESPIPTAVPEDEGPTKFLWGTSMACPHVAGAVSLFLQSQPIGRVPTPDEADAWIKRHASYVLDENNPLEPGITTLGILKLPDCNYQP